MKRYLLFVFDQHYPSGGWNDFKGDFDRWDYAIHDGMEYLGRGRDHFHVIDSTTGKYCTNGGP